VDRDRDKNRDKINPKPSSSQVHSPEMDELYRRLQPEMNRPKPSPEALSAALEAAQRLAAEADAEQAADDTAQELSGDFVTIVCRGCGYRNREGNKFCGMCGTMVAESQESQAATRREIPEREIPEQDRLPSRALALPDFALPNNASPQNAFLDHDPAERRATTQPSGLETHHYHHHYHHHYFPGGDAMAGRSSTDAMRDPVRESVREDKPRVTAAQRGDMSRAEAAVRSVTHEWVLGCNTKHLDDMLDLYTADAMVLRSNCAPIRGAAAIREFFFGALDAGLGEVELEPLRVEVIGDFAYEAGRCKALVPSASGKRREERGKYLWVCVRQSNNEWKLAADCWSADLTLGNLESDVPQSTGVKTTTPRRL
jgi:uncharacterized protein (TIGR02246 family)